MIGKLAKNGIIRQWKRPLGDRMFYSIQSNERHLVSDSLIGKHFPPSYATEDADKDDELINMGFVGVRLSSHIVPTRSQSRSAHMPQRQEALNQGTIGAVMNSTENPTVESKTQSQQCDSNGWKRWRKEKKKKTDRILIFRPMHAYRRFSSSTHSRLAHTPCRHRRRRPRRRRQHCEETTKQTIVLHWIPSSWIQSLFGSHPTQLWFSAQAFSTLRTFAFSWLWFESIEFFCILSHFDSSGGFFIKILKIWLLFVFFWWKLIFRKFLEKVIDCGKF